MNLGEMSEKRPHDELPQAFGGMGQVAWATCTFRFAGKCYASCVWEAPDGRKKGHSLRRSDFDDDNDGDDEVRNVGIPPLNARRLR